MCVCVCRCTIHTNICLKASSKDIIFNSTLEVRKKTFLFDIEKKALLYKKSVVRMKQK